MTIIAILLAFAIHHWFKPLGGRHWRWVRHYRQGLARFGQRLPGWQGPLGFLLILLLPLIGIWLLTGLASAIGPLGLFIFSTALLVVSFGPRDLARDVDDLVESEEDRARQAAAARLGVQRLPEDDTACSRRLIAAIFQQGLRRWFAVIFWFAILGVWGAVLYRLVDELCYSADPGSSRARQWRRAREILDWPVAQLMTLALAIATDFDAVYDAWKTFHDRQGHSLFEGDNGFLLAAAQRVVMGGDAARDGYADQLDGPMVASQLAMDLTWRVMGVWLAVLAVLLLVGVIV